MKSYYAALLGAAREECGLVLKIEVNPEGTATGGSSLATLLQMFYKFFLQGRSEQHPSAVTAVALVPSPTASTLTVGSPLAFHCTPSTGLQTIVFI